MAEIVLFLPRLVSPPDRNPRLVPKASEARLLLAWHDSLSWIRFRLDFGFFRSNDPSFFPWFFLDFTGTGLLLAIIQLLWSLGGKHFTRSLTFCFCQRNKQTHLRDLEVHSNFSLSVTWIFSWESGEGWGKYCSTFFLCVCFFFSVQSYFKNFQII